MTSTLRRRKPLIGLFLALILFTGCNLPGLAQGLPLGDGHPSPQAETSPATVTLRVQVPSTEGDITLALLDEVTGLNINPTRIPMQSVGQGIYEAQVTAPVGAVLKYRYERHTADGTVALEALYSGRPVRYRLLRVDGVMHNDDLVARWNDTLYQGAVGRIQGRVTDPEGHPIPDVLITAAGAQTTTLADGSFLLPDIPVGEHNLVAYHPDGRYRTFQQRAIVAADAATDAPITMSPAPMVRVTFNLTAPPNTLQGAPVRLAGNLRSLGNTFADLGGSLSTLASQMPILHPTDQPQHYTLTLTLPAGADIRYKYTLGDGFWNAEHDAQGRFVIRQHIIPDHDTTFNDTVATWSGNESAPLWFEVQVPADTPVADMVDIQFNPAVWTPPLPMWPLGEGRWGYLLFGPSAAPQITYRFCRNEQCAAALQAPTNIPQTFAFAEQPQTLKTQIQWQWWGTPSETIRPPDTTPQPREDDFWRGVALLPGGNPTWQPYIGRACHDVRALHADILILTPTWTAELTTQPVWAPQPGADASAEAIYQQANTARSMGLTPILFPRVRFPQGAAAWWQFGRHDFPWWVSWFDRYTAFATHFASIARESGAAGLILGGAWLTPSLPRHTMPDGSPAGAPADTEQRWRALLAAVREIYPGPIYWAMPLDDAAAPPPFLDAVDGIYLLWQPDLGADTANWAQATADLLDNRVQPLAATTQKPIVLAVGYPSAAGAQGGCVPADGACLPAEALTPDRAAALTVDLQRQAVAYAALLQAVAQRPWVHGVVSADFYPPAPLQDPSASIHGKPAADLVRWWFAHWHHTP